jgi:hypothetical protein
MTSNELLEFEDVGGAVRDARPFRKARAYRVLFAQDNLNFRPLDLADPVPLGRQILSAAGLDPANGFSLFAIIPGGDFEDVRLDELFDLRARGADQFVAFQTDRLFKLTINDHQLEWGKPAISGAALYKLAKVTVDDVVFLQVRGEEARLIKPAEIIDLTAVGIERFITGPKPVLTFEIIVNGRPRVVNDENVSFEQVVQLAFPGPHGPNIVFSMTYRHAASKPHAGEVGTGGVVEVKTKGTIFNVTKTDKS